MAQFARPPGHYKQIIVRNQRRATRLAETHDGSSPDYDFSEDHGSCSRQFYTIWNETGAAGGFSLIPQIRADILGDISIGFAKSQKYIARTIPMEHEGFPNTLFAHSVRVMGAKGEPTRADSVGIQSFDEAILHVGYTQLPYAVLSDEELAVSSGTGFPDEGSLLRYVSVDQQVAAKYQVIPAFGSLMWTRRNSGVPGSTPDDPQDGGPRPGSPVIFKNAMILFEGDIILTWHDVPLEAYPVSAITVLVGRTNRNPFGHPSSVLGQIPAQTLVCGPPKRKLRRLRNGQLGYDISYAFKYYPQGANNNFWMGVGGRAGYYPFAADPAGTMPLFPLDGGGDPIKNPLQFTFEDLFRPEQ